MDIASIIGIVLALVGILLGQALEGGSARQILQPTAALIVFGGTFGATLVNFPLRVVLAALRELTHAFIDREQHPETIIQQIVGYAVKARKEGIISLEGEAAQAEDPFIKKALIMAVDGTNPKELRHSMEMELAYLEEHNELTVKVFEAAGGYAPTIGILGAVIGLIQVMQNLEDVAEVGKGIAVAFVATIYGVGSANLFFLPIAGKLKIKQRRMSILAEMALEGIISILEGLNPRIIEDRLRSFFSTEIRRAAETEQEKAA